MTFKPMSQGWPIFCLCWGFTAQSTHRRAQSVYLTTLLLGRLSPLFKAVNQYWAHSFPRNWQLPFLEQRKEENNRRKYLMVNLNKSMLPTWDGGMELATRSPAGCTSNWATEAGLANVWPRISLSCFHNRNVKNIHTPFTGVLDFDL